MRHLSKIRILLIAAFALGVIYFVSQREHSSHDGIVDSAGKNAPGIPHSRDSKTEESSQSFQGSGPEYWANQQKLWDEERKKLGMEIERSPKINREINGIVGSIRDYYSVLHEYPVGTNADVARALLGQNREKKLFLGWRPHKISSSGALKDHWGTEFYIRVEDSGKVIVRSAGPDRQMWTEDDVQPMKD
jgi:hypothetical protein